MDGKNRNYPFKDWVPKWVGILVLILMFFPPSFSGGTYLGNLSEMQGALGIYSESVQMGNHMVFIGMCLFLPFMIPYLQVRRPKAVFLWSFAALAVLNLSIAAGINEAILFASCLMMGFVRIIIMLNCTFTIAPYMTGFNSLVMLTVEVDPHSEAGEKQDKARTMLMPVLYMAILAIINLCNVIMTRVAYAYDWRQPYYLETGILLAGMLLALITMEDEPKGEPFVMDWRRFPDMLLMGAFLVSLCYVMDYGKTLDWFSSPSIKIASSVGLISLGAFILLQVNREGEAYLPFEILKYRNVWIAALIFIVMVIVNASNVLNTSFAHLASPADDMHIGAQNRWAMLGVFIGLLIAFAMILAHVSFRIIFFVSFMLMGASNLLMYFLFQSQILLGQLVWPIILMNAGLLILYSLVAAYGMHELPNHLLSTFVFIMIFTRNAFAPPIGSSIYSNWLYQRQQYHLQVMSEQVDPILAPGQALTASSVKSATVQATLAAMKDVTGKTLWILCGISTLILLMPGTTGKSCQPILKKCLR